MRQTTVKLFTLAALICVSNGPYYSQQARVARAQDPPFPFIDTVNGMLGFIDAAGKVTIQPQFEVFVRSDVHPIASLKNALGEWKFVEGLARVKVGIAYGFINEKGETVIPARYADAGHLSGGLARVKQGNKYGFINPRGDLIIRPVYDAASDFSEGLAAVAVGGQYTFIDTLGKTLTVRRFDGAGDFSEGFAAVESGGRFGFIDKSGSVVIEPRFEAAYPFSEGLSGVKIDGKYGFVDKKGNAVIAPQFTEINEFSEGLARVKVRTEGTELYGYIEPSGRFVIRPQFFNAGNFSHGLAWVQVTVDHRTRYGYIDKRNEFAIPPTLDAAADFAGGLALVGFQTITQRLGTLQGNDPELGPRRPPGIAGAREVNYVLTNETVVYGYITPKGEQVFRGVWLFKGQIPMQAGPIPDRYSQRSQVAVNIATTPGGATVYIIPFIIWDTTPGMIDDSSKLFNHRQSKYTTNNFDVSQDVYVVVLEHGGRRCAVKKDINQYRDRAIDIDFNREGECRRIQ